MLKNYSTSIHKKKNRLSLKQNIFSFIFLLFSISNFAQQTATIITTSNDENWGITFQNTGNSLNWEASGSGISLSTSGNNPTFDFSSNNENNEITIVITSSDNFDFTTELIANAKNIISIDLSNANNLTKLEIQNNPKLTCIQVSSETNANGGLGIYTHWKKDDFAVYSEDCNRKTYVPDDGFEAYLISVGYDNLLDDYVLTTSMESITQISFPPFVPYFDGQYEHEFYIEDLTGIEACASLKHFDIDINYCSIIDLSNNLLLETFGLYGSNVYSNITSLDFSKNILLKKIHLESKLENLDISKNIALTSIHIFNNPKLEILNIKNNNNSIITNFSCTNNTGLTCIQVDNAVYSTTYWTDKDNTTTFSEDCNYNNSVLDIEDELLANGLNLYPNPVSNILNIESKLPLEKVMIYSILGQKVIEINSNFNSIPTENLSSGIYMVRLHSEKGTTIRKLLKK